jgi:hypothetical protein
LQTFHFSKPGQEITQLILCSNLIFGLILHETIPGVVAQQFAAAAGGGGGGGAAAAAEIAHNSQMFGFYVV